MIIIMLATAMGLAMLIATAFALHREAGLAQQRQRSDTFNKYLPG
jgi:hypothetical protein